MARQKRITVRGKQQLEIDPLVFLQVMLAISEGWERNTKQIASAPDSRRSAVEDVTELGG